jgi:RND family efflux transporter MFP subunit
MPRHRTPEPASAAARPLRRRLLGLAGVTGMAGLIIAAVIGAVAVLHARAGADAAATPPDPLPVTTIIAQMQDGYEVVERYAGRLEAARATRLAFERDGLVLAVLVEEGDRVAAGQPIARMDIAPLEARRDALLAEQRRVEARLALAEATEARQRRLVDQGHSAEQRYDEVRYEVEALAAQLDGIAADIRRLDIDIAKSIITAPFAGTVAARMVDEGAVAAPGAPVVEIIETGRPEARIGIPPDAATALQVGSSHTIHIAGRAVEATLTALRPDLDGRTRTVTALFRLDRPVAAPVGEVVRWERRRLVETGGAWLPLSALREGENGLWTLMTVAGGPNGPEIALEAAEVVHVSGDRAFVRGSFAAGARVVAEGHNRVVPGQPVEPVQPTGG